MAVGIGSGSPHDPELYKWKRMDGWICNEMIKIINKTHKTLKMNHKYLFCQILKFDKDENFLEKCIICLLLLLRYRGKMTALCGSSVTFPVQITATSDTVIASEADCALGRP